MPDQAIGDTERTTLSGERTALAWWRTGLAAIAVGIAVGRVVPALDPGGDLWPYTVVGATYVVYGMALIAYGTIRGKGIGEAAVRGEMSQPSSPVTWSLAGAAILIGMATLGLILI